MENTEVIKKVKEYLFKYKTVDLIWFIETPIEGLGLQKNKRDFNIINQEITDCLGFSNYTSHNPNDIGIKYSPSKRKFDMITRAGGIVGLIGGILGIISFFKH